MSGLDEQMNERPQASLFARRSVRWTLLVAILLLGIGVRLIDLTDPPLDFHPVRQLRSALIARSVYYQHTPDVSAEERQQASDLADLEDYEPPILEQLVGWSYVLAGGEKAWLARVFNALFWAIGGLAIAGLLYRAVSFPAILAALAFYFFLPFSVVASRSFQPEPWMVMWVLLTALALKRWAEKRSLCAAVIAGVLGGIAILVKVVSGFFVLAMLAWVVLFALGLKKTLRSGQAWLMGLLMVLPTLGIYLFQLDRTSGFLSFWVGALSWLITTTEFYADWLAMIKSLAGLMTLLAALLGILTAARADKAWLLGLWSGYVLYGLVFPYQYVTHEYYHLPLVGLLALSLAFAFEPVYHGLRKQPWVWRLAAAGVLVFASFYGAYVSRSILVASDYRHEPAAWQEVGERIPQGAAFIALSGDYGMRLRYYGHRIGASWPTSGDLNLKSLSSDEVYNFKAYFDELTAGKEYFVVTALNELNNQSDLKGYLADHYPLYYESDDFLIYQLIEK